MADPFANPRENKKTVVQDIAEIMPQIKELLEREQKRRVIGEFFSGGANFILKTSAFIGAFAFIFTVLREKVKIWLG